MSIKSIRSTASELNSDRIAQIKLLIKSIAANQSIHPQRVSSTSGDNQILFCVTDSSKITDLRQFNNGGVVNERFKTINKRYNASYYELWDKIIGTKSDYHLQRIYFHLYLAENDDEFILLHTDPIDQDATHGIYKRSPHLHIKSATDDIIGHAHFALNINDYDVALSSIPEINKCFKNHIDMLKHQILQR